MTQGCAYTALLGGIGGDSHSVGLQVLRDGLTASGFQVVFLGTQNRLSDFFDRAARAHVVLISCMDGHAPHYLRRFPELRQELPDDGPLWYLGGNPLLGRGCFDGSQLLAMGFARVFTTFIDVEGVIELLTADLYGVDPLRGGGAAGFEAPRLPSPSMITVPADDTVPLDALLRERREVLGHWPTGAAAADLEQNAEFLRQVPSFGAAQARSGRHGKRTLVQPRSGVPLVGAQIELFGTLSRAGANVLSYQVDSLTRNNDYAGAATAIVESRRDGKCHLNGFPVVCHGVPALRRIVRETSTPLQTRHSTRDPRLLAEISYAGGVTAYEGGAICYNLPYYRDYPLAESIRAWQYVDRLTGLYHERHGVVLDREFFGVLTATLIPPSLAIAVCLLETLLAVQQGVRCVSLGYAEQGHRVQDVAAIRTMGRMARELLDRMGYRRVQVNTVFHQYMAAFPPGRRRAEELIYESAITAGLSGATRILTKSPAEAIDVPGVDDNLRGLWLVARGLAAASRLRLDEARVEQESSLIENEVRSILDAVIHLGGGHIAAGVVLAFQRGVLDIPFSPSLHNAGRVRAIRDSEGAVRYLETGGLPLDADVRAYHREKMQERFRAERIPASRRYRLVEKDVLQVARNDYERWPLNPAEELLEPAGRAEPDLPAAPAAVPHAPRARRRPRASGLPRG